MSGGTALRLGVYGEFAYRRDAAGLSSDQAFVVFLNHLAGQVQRLVVIGRLDPTPGRSHHALTEDAEFVELADYGSLGSGLGVVRSTIASIPVLWRSLDGVDAVWLLGPNPMGIVLALLAMLRRRGVVLGIRQDIVKLTRSRYGRDLHLAAAVALERIWRLLARRSGVTPVGPDLASQYAFAKRVLPISISLIERDLVATPEQALARDYSGELRILSVGRLEPQKNPLLLADVAAQLKQRAGNWRLTICGDGTLAAGLRERIEQLGLGEMVEMRGYVAVGGGLDELYRDSHVFLHVSNTEGFPQVLLEAFAAGLPTVATDVGGVGGWVGGAAALIPPGDPVGAAEAIERVIDDTGLREEMVREGIAAALAHTAEAECARLAAFIGQET